MKKVDMETGYLALLRSLLIQSLNDYYFGTRPKKEEARLWLFEEEGMITFLYACFHLGLNAEYWRWMILRCPHINRLQSGNIRKSKWLLTVAKAMAIKPPA